MKHIKLYEELNTYYYPITYDESCILQNKAVDINLSTKQLLEIEKILNRPIRKNNLDIIYFDENINSTNSKEIPFIYIRQDWNPKGPVDAWNMYERINIIRLDDEWFIVEWPKKNLIGGEPQKFFTPSGFTNKYYAKCDQFEGDLELLRLYQNFTD